MAWGRGVPGDATGLEIEFRAFLTNNPPGVGLIVNVGTYVSTEATWQEPAGSPVE